MKEKKVFASKSYPNIYNYPTVYLYSICVVYLQMILLENADSQKRHYEKKCEDMAQRLRECEKTLTNAQKEISGYQVRM